MPKGSPMKPLHVSLLAVPEVMISTLSGIYDVLNGFEMVGTIEDEVPREKPFQVEIVSPAGNILETASGLPLRCDRTMGEVLHSDMIIVPALMVYNRNWQRGRYDAVVEWIRRLHAQGAMLYSACSGILLLAETGLLHGREATVHWAYADTFRQNYPDVELLIDEVLVASGEQEEIVMSGASASWHDLVLYLISRHVSPAAANAIARFMLLQWHTDGQAPYVKFSPDSDHGDADVAAVQEWLAENYVTVNPVEEMTTRSGLTERSFNRRFSRATGMTPLAYVQRLRIERAKRMLEETDLAVDEISWQVGYQEPAFFRRLFKRITRLTPGQYRRKFSISRG